MEDGFSSRGRTPLILTVPGLGGSGPDHWQSIWEATRSDCARVDLGLWSRPQRNSWVTRLNQAISAAPAPVILVAHSLGCHAVAWWAALEGQPYGWPVAGALLVAPPDCEAEGVKGAVGSFAPVSKAPLPFPSIVVASRDDMWASIDRAHSMAKFWGSHFVDVGALGHLNAESGLGPWLFGQRLLDRLIASVGERARVGEQAGPWSLYPPAAGPGALMGEPAF